MNLWNRIKDFFGIYEEDEEWFVPPPRDEDSDDLVTKRTVFVPDIVRNVLYDTGLKDVESAMSRLGFYGQSNEVSEMSRKDSLVRVSALVDIAPIISLLSDAVSTGLGGHMVTEVEDNFSEYLPAGADPEEYLISALETQRRLIEASVISVLANLVDMGFIEVSNVAVAVVDEETGTTHTSLADSLADYFNQEDEDDE